MGEPISPRRIAAGLRTRESVCSVLNMIASVRKLFQSVFPDSQQHAECYSGCLQYPEVGLGPWSAKKQAERLVYVGLCLRTLHRITIVPWTGEQLQDIIPNDPAYKEGLLLLNGIMLGALPVTWKDLTILKDGFDQLTEQLSLCSSLEKHGEVNIKLVYKDKGLFLLMEKVLIQCKTCLTQRSKTFKEFKRIKELLQSPQAHADSSWCQSCHHMFLDLFAHVQSQDVDYCHLRMLASLSFTLPWLGLPEEVKGQLMSELQEDLSGSMIETRNESSIEIYFLSGFPTDKGKRSEALFYKTFLEKHSKKKFIINDQYRTRRHCCEMQVLKYIKTHEKTLTSLLSIPKDYVESGTVRLVLEQSPCENCREELVPNDIKQFLEGNLSDNWNFEIGSIMPYKKKTKEEPQLLNRLLRPCSIHLSDQLREIVIGNCQICKEEHPVTVYPIPWRFLVCRDWKCMHAICQEGHCLFTTMQTIFLFVNYSDYSLL